MFAVKASIARPIFRARFAAVQLPRFYSVVADAPAPTKRKVWDSVEEAIADVKSGDVLLSGGTSMSAHIFCCTTQTGSVRMMSSPSRIRTLRYTRCVCVVLNATLHRGAAD